MNKFAVWLLEELNKQGWQQSEFAKEAKIGTGTLSNVLSGNRKPGWDFCVSVAQALNIPPDEVFRRAGLLPQSTAPDKPDYEQLKEVAAHLNNEELSKALEYVRWRYRVQERQKKNRQNEEDR